VYAFPYGIVVNGRAERFFDEGKDSFDSTFEELGFEIWRNQQQKAFFIGDQTTLGIEHVQAIILTDQPPVTAGSLAELARQLRLEPQALERTVAAYNAAIGPGEFNAHIRDGKAAPALVPPKSNWAFPIVGEQSGFRGAVRRPALEIVCQGFGRRIQRAAGSFAVARAASTRRSRSGRKSAVLAPPAVATCPILTYPLSRAAKTSMKPWPQLT
jgi:hypothetical protein